MWSSTIPSNSRFIQILYNSVSNSIIASFSRKNSEGSVMEELYVRHCSGLDYRKIFLESEYLSARTAVTCADCPLVIFNEWNVLRSPQKGFDWKSISSYDLLKGQLKSIMDTNSFPVPEGYVRGWVVSIISASANGRSLIASVAHERSTGSSSSLVEYYLSEIDLDRSLVTLIAPLNNVFV